eukprot:1432753-Amphidinium_carterae.1
MKKASCCEPLLFMVSKSEGRAFENSASWVLQQTLPSRLAIATSKGSRNSLVWTEFLASGT